MSLTDHIATPPPAAIHGRPCSVGAAFDALDDEEREALHTMLASPDWSDARVHQALTAEGFTVGRQTVGTHRRRQCRCAKEQA